MCAFRVLLLSSSLALVLLSQSTAPAQAAWPHDPTVNVPVCTVGGQRHAKAISDGGSGAIITWRDDRSGTDDIYAQRVSPAGATQWTADGVAVCTAANEQSAPCAVTDGGSGAIVAWQDYRNGAWDIYAQRISATGMPQWTVNGVAVCTAGNEQSAPCIVSDGAGGAIVAWTDYRLGNFDIYAQRISAAGVPEWSVNGVAVCAAANEQGTPCIVTDGASGAVVAWRDYRSSDHDIYAQRISAVGAPQWTVNGVALCTAVGLQRDPTMIASGAGGALVAWMDWRSGTGSDVYAQRVSASGVPLWTADGVAVCVATDNQMFPLIVPDGRGGGIVAWEDGRLISSWAVYAQHVSAWGVAQWATDGVAFLPVVGSQEYPSLGSDGAGGAIVAWQESRGDEWDIRAQRISTNGVAQWTTCSVEVCGAVGGQFYPTIATDGESGVIVAWQDYRDNALGQIYSQRVDRFGYLGNPEPVIASVRDVPNDEGDSVKLSWYPSWLDQAFDANLAAYDILRSVPASAVSAALALGRRVSTLGERAGVPAVGDVVAQPLGAATYFWEYLASVTPLHYVDGYSYVAPTTCDSVGGSNPFTAFMVVGRNAAYTMYWLSAPDSGYSVDDLSPATPTVFAGQYDDGTVTLSWDANREADLGGYRVYRGSTADFAPGPGNLLVELTATGCVDVAGRPYWYKLSAVDVHGNESGYAVLLPAGTADVPGGSAPTELALALGSANPARGGTTLRWALPVEGGARLVVYDVQGRVVRELVTGRQPAGVHATGWDGRDAAGHAVAAGLYLARLEAMGRALSVRVVLVR